MNDISKGPVIVTRATSGCQNDHINLPPFDNILHTDREFLGEWGGGRGRGKDISLPPPKTSLITWTLNSDTSL